MEADVPRLAARVLSFVPFARIVREVEKNLIEEILFFGRGDGVASDDVSGDGVTRRRPPVIVGEGFLPYRATYCRISFSWWSGMAQRHYILPNDSSVFTSRRGDVQGRTTPGHRR